MEQRDFNIFPFPRNLPLLNCLPYCFLHGQLHISVPFDLMSSDALLHGDILGSGAVHLLVTNTVQCTALQFSWTALRAAFVSKGRKFSRILDLISSPFSSYGCVWAAGGEDERGTLKEDQFYSCGHVHVHFGSEPRTHLYLLKPPQTGLCHCWRA